VLLGPDVLDASAFVPTSRFYAQLEAIRERVHTRSRIWFRTCETFGAQAGHSFAERVSDFFGCRAAGHTYIIGAWQSGLHSIGPGERARWPIEEGLREGTPSAPQRAFGSAPWRPNTIHALVSDVPIGW
jgi:hypothetical protein